MAFRRFDHIDEIINVTRAIGDTMAVELGAKRLGISPLSIGVSD